MSFIFNHSEHTRDTYKKIYDHKFLTNSMYSNWKKWRELWWNTRHNAICRENVWFFRCSATTEENSQEISIFIPIYTIDAASIRFSRNFYSAINVVKEEFYNSHNHEVKEPFSSEWNRKMFHFNIQEWRNFFFHLWSMLMDFHYNSESVILYSLNCTDDEEN